MLSRVGRGQTIDLKGEGLLGMCLGERRKLIVPTETIRYGLFVKEIPRDSRKKSVLFVQDKEIEGKGNKIIKINDSRTQIGYVKNANTKW